MRSEEVRGDLLTGTMSAVYTCFTKNMCFGDMIAERPKGTRFIKQSHFAKSFFSMGLPFIANLYDMPSFSWQLRRCW